MFQINGFVLGIGFEFLRNDNVFRQNDFAVVRLGGFHNFFGGLNHIHLNQRIGFVDGINAAGFHKGVRHTAGNNQHIDLFNQIIQQVKLGGNLGTADNRHQRAFRIVQTGRQSIDFFFHQQAHCGRTQLNGSDHGSMGAVRRRKSIGNINVCRFNQVFGKFFIAFFLLVIETQIFKQQNFIAFHRFNRGFNLGADAVINENDFMAESFFQFGGNVAEGIFHIAFAFRTAEVRNNDDLGSLFHQGFDGRNRTVNARGVGYVKVFIHRHVQVCAQHNDFAVQIA